MPLMVTVNRNKFAKKALIISSIVVGVFFILAILDRFVLKIFDIGPMMFNSAIALLAVNTFYAVLYGFFVKKNKTLYLVSVIATVSLVPVLAIVGFAAKMPIFTHTAWLIALYGFFYFMGEAYNNSTINARLFGEGIAVFLVFVVDWIISSASGSKTMEQFLAKYAQGHTVTSAIMLGITFIMMIIPFIHIFTRKIALTQIGTAKFFYDTPTNDEEALNSRAKGEKLDTIPRLYEGDVYAFADVTIERIIQSVKFYLDHCNTAINDLNKFAKNYADQYFENVDEWNDYVRTSNNWRDSIQEEAEKFTKFINEIVKHRYLDAIDKGKTFVYHFDEYKFEVKTDGNSNEKFKVKLIGFTRTFSYKATKGTLKEKAEFDAPDDPWVPKLGFHPAEEDSASNQPGYHLPGTPMPVND